MLAFMPPSPSLHNRQSTSSSSNSTMSLAILPSSPVSYSQASLPALLPQSSNPSKRPKLSLNTANTIAAFGKKSTSMRLETLSATSPTAVNTFSNGYHPEPAFKSSTVRPQKPLLTPLSTNVTSTQSRVSTPLQSELLDSTTSSATSTSSSSSVESLSGDIPYKLAYNVTSILCNGPYPKSRGRTMYSQARPMFPASKKVAFRAPLTEDVRTSKYTMAHIDLLPSLATSTYLFSPAKAESEQTEPAGDDETTADDEESDVSVPSLGEKRDALDEDDSDKCPQTPVAGRRKRHRQWVWTLGPVNSDMGVSSNQVAGADRKEGFAEDLGTPIS